MAGSAAHVCRRERGIYIIAGYGRNPQADGFVTQVICIELDQKKTTTPICRDKNTAYLYRRSERLNKKNAVIVR